MLIKTFLFIFIFLLFISCQENSSQSVSSNDEPSQDPAIERQIFELSIDEFSPAVISIPDPNMLGAAKRITFNNKSYLIGHQTNAEVVAIIMDLSMGEYQIEIKGRIDEESGHFPNPTVSFPVIQIEEVRMR